MTKINGHHTGRGDNKNDDNKYTPTHPELEATTELSNSEPVIPFALGGKESVSTVVGYTELTFTVFSRGYLLVPIHWYGYQQRHGGLGGG